MSFLAMLDRFHESWPDVGFRLMIHFNHPDEFLLKGDVFTKKMDGPAYARCLELIGMS